MAVSVQNARPETLNTMWVRLRGEDDSGNSFGGNPLVSVPGKPDLWIPGNPLIPSSYISAALEAVHAPVENPVQGLFRILMAGGQ